MEVPRIKTIRVLPIEEMFFMKKIYLENSSSSDIVCYARMVSRGYKLTPKEDPDGTHLYLGYKEEEYPCDELDREILKQIQEKFSNATPHTSLMMFNVDKENDAQWLAQYQKEKLTVSIVYSPSHGSLTDADACHKEIEVLLRGMQRHLNTNISITTDQPEKFRHLSSLLNETYDLFSNACIKQQLKS